MALKIYFIPGFFLEITADGSSEQTTYIALSKDITDGS
jgi:hypothetical protein